MTKASDARFAFLRKEGQRVYDVVVWTGAPDEPALFDLRKKVLGPYVDGFVVIEADQTYSGDDKKVTFPVDRNRDLVAQNRLHVQVVKLTRKRGLTAIERHQEHMALVRDTLNEVQPPLNPNDIIMMSMANEVPRATNLTYAFSELPRFNIVCLLMDGFVHDTSNLRPNAMAGTVMSQFKFVVRIGTSDLRLMRSKQHLVVDGGARFDLFTDERFGGRQNAVYYMMNHYDPNKKLHDLMSSYEDNRANGVDTLDMMMDGGKTRKVQPLTPEKLVGLPEP